ncbi:Carboxypeptidase regulatory-like domain-containing protein [Luteibacter sp. UNC138MFCol5.1]|uniref:carboxypeptidase-like regulatory domain-containing protein n=1 Tax=Luteibacter sp. UNC138MFCol5.1 TaxID=1502774 RepID=UPI0008BAF502|nr:carboxypeptidase-like regulatory domain-containing protein [Luteibacter sp. UNC138MFCol5.1]SEO32337.1 Carboxypeptidase regulatory-like domain-containing protein [Luteibacter sp. UNC138MFCol5.1]
MNHILSTNGMRRVALVAAVAVGAAICAPVQAQSTAGTIGGHGPAGAKVVAVSSAGLHRDTTIDKKGRYRLGNLPMGTYTVTLDKDGTTVDTRKNIPIRVGANSQIDFACENDVCEAGG